MNTYQDVLKKSETLLDSLRNYKELKMTAERFEIAIDTLVNALINNVSLYKELIEINTNINQNTGKQSILNHAIIDSVRNLNKEIEDNGLILKLLLDTITRRETDNSNFEVINQNNKMLTKLVQEKNIPHKIENHAWYKKFEFSIFYFPYNYYGRSVNTIETKKLYGFTLRYASVPELSFTWMPENFSRNGFVLTTNLSVWKALDNRIDFAVGLGINKVNKDITPCISIPVSINLFNIKNINIGAYFLLNETFIFSDKNIFKYSYDYVGCGLSISIKSK